MSQELELAGPTVVVAGATASGKGELSRRLAKRFGVRVASMDSMKVYRGMDIGSAKPAVSERDRYSCIDVIDPWEEFSIADYLVAVADSGIADERVTLFAGGTGLYLNTLIEGIFRGPPPDPERRAALEELADAEGESALVDRLRSLDPESADRIHGTDRRRLIRAIEVCEVTGESFTELQRTRTPILRPGSFRLIGVRHPREELHARIDERVLRMFDAGWVDEVKALMAAHDPPWSHAANQSIGYAQIREALDAGEEPRDRIPKIQARTRQFARHQLIWFRKMPIEWWSPAEFDALEADLEQSLSDYAGRGTFEPAPEERLSSEGI